MVVDCVTVFFDPSGNAADQVLAANQHVYLDVTEGSLTHLRTDAQGLLVSPPGTAAPQASRPGVCGRTSRNQPLDDTRTYRLYLADRELAAAPGIADAAEVRLQNGRLLVRPHIAIRLRSDLGLPVTNLACVLTIGSTSRNVTSNANGWVLSADRTDGQLTLRADTRLLKRDGDPNPTAPLTAAPAAPTRGDAVTVTVAPPTGAVGFKAREWHYDLDHTNPGAAAATADIRRPATESPGTFDQNWQGTVCASGRVRLLFVLGLSLRASGAAAVAANLTALDPVESTLRLTVAARTGTAWESQLVENAEQSWTQAISTFAHTGQHRWSFSNSAVTPIGSAIATGPNRGCLYVQSASVTFTSTPRINADLISASSTFSQAQDRAYLIRPPPVRVIPRNLYTVGAGGRITLTNEAAFAQAMNIGPGVAYQTSDHCIDQARLLAGTRRHEYQHADASHKANCLKARRALDPVKYAEALVRPPGASLNFTQLFNARVQAVAGVSDTHDVVDEARTRSEHAVQFVPNRQILAVNVDDQGGAIGPVWNPTQNRELTN